MVTAILVFLWVIIGIGAASAHMSMLRSAVRCARSQSPTVAKKQITKGLPLRLLLWLPILLFAAHSGLIACVAIIAGSLLARWFVQLRVLYHAQPIAVSSEQGEGHGC